MANSKKASERTGGREQGEMFRMRVSDVWLHELDEWRRLQPDIPGRSEAARRIVSERIEADATKATRTKPKRK